MARNAWVSMRCAGTAAPLTGRLQLTDGSWLLTETAAGTEPDAAEPDAAALKGSFGISPSYRGCAGCGNGSYVLCRCSTVACWSGSGRFRCPVCGGEGAVEGSIDALVPDDVG